MQIFSQKGDGLCWKEIFEKLAVTLTGIVDFIPLYREWSGIGVGCGVQPQNGSNRRRFR